MRSKIRLIALGEPPWSIAVLPALRVWQDCHIEWSGRNSLGTSEISQALILFPVTVHVYCSVQNSCTDSQ